LNVSGGTCSLVILQYITHTTTITSICLCKAARAVLASCCACAYAAATKHACNTTSPANNSNSNTTSSSTNNDTCETPDTTDSQQHISHCCTASYMCVATVSPSFYSDRIQVVLHTCRGFIPSGFILQQVLLLHYSTVSYQIL
jgi:hypothetical protein